MEEYHKIQTVFKRDPGNKHKTLLEWDFSIPEFDYLKDNMWVFTEKVDGTNIRVMYDGNEIVFGGKSDSAQIPATLVRRLNKMFLPKQETFEDILQIEKDGLNIQPICLYGEGYGPKIEKGGGNYGPEQDFVLFDVKIGDWWLKREDVEDIGSELGLDIVPILGTGTLRDMVSYVKSGIISTWGDFQAEGIVARPEIELKTRAGNRIITKLKCKDFKNE